MKNTDFCILSSLSPFPVMKEKEKREETDSKKKNMEEEKGEEKQQRDILKFVGMLLETFRKI